MRQPICRVKEIKHVSRLRVVPRTEQSVGVVARVDIPKYLKNKSPIFPSQFYPQFIRLVSAAALLIRLVGYPVISSCEFFPELANIHISVFCIWVDLWDYTSLMHKPRSHHRLAHIARQLAAMPSQAALLIGEITHARPEWEQLSSTLTLKVFLFFISKKKRKSLTVCLFDFEGISVWNKRTIPCQLQKWRIRRCRGYISQQHVYQIHRPIR